MHFGTNLVEPNVAQPSIMIMPSDKWCADNGFSQDVGGKLIPNYRDALRDDELPFAITQIQGIFQSYGFRAVDMYAAMDKLELDEAEDMVTETRDGGMVQESFRDELFRVASADIVVYITWVTNTKGPMKELTFELKAIDSYTSKPVATASGTGAPL